ncbi:MAG TPA: DNA-directed RNA polymerase subunit omega [Planctomycetes bacterium]|nr:DNA-directed RNA polymerase subunit omega [Planctomycetota bacterium]
MIDPQRLENLFEKCGGVFRATVLIQMRIRELTKGAKRLVDGDFRNPIDIAIAEIEQDKIELVEDTEENRELIRKEIEKLTGGHRLPQAEVPLESSEDELERRILSALSKDTEA